MSIRALEPRDVAPILAIQSACPEIAKWNARDYERVVQGEMAGWVFEAQNKLRVEIPDNLGDSRNPHPAVGRHAQERSDEVSLFDVDHVPNPGRKPDCSPNVSETRMVVGFLIARRVASDMEILNFAVRPHDRRLGTGAALLGSALNWARSFSAEHAILEVRSANETALRFYEHHKFQIVGRRRNYYNSPNDDALLLTLNLA